MLMGCKMILSNIIRLDILLSLLHLLLVLVLLITKLLFQYLCLVVEILLSLKLRLLLKLLVIVMRVSQRIWTNISSSRLQKLRSNTVSHRLLLIRLLRSFGILPFLLPRLLILTWHLRLSTPCPPGLEVLADLIILSIIPFILLHLWENSVLVGPQLPNIMHSVMHSHLLNLLPSPCTVVSFLLMLALLFTYLHIVSLLLVNLSLLLQLFLRMLR